jgi:hypothetical protein
METKKSIGKLYEKFEIVKNFNHQLEVAVAQNHLTGQEEFVIVWVDPNDEDKKMPLAQILTGTEIQEYLEPDFTKSLIASELFKMYSKYDTRQTVEEYDESMDGDEDYSLMLKNYDDGLSLAKALMNEDEILKNLEKLLGDEEE